MKIIIKWAERGFWASLSFFFFWQKCHKLAQFSLPVHISRKTYTASQQGPLPRPVSVLLHSRHVMSSPPTWWTSYGSRAGPGLFPQRRSSGWSVSSTASSAPSRCSSSRARVRPSWSCAPGFWMHGECPGEGCPLGELLTQGWRPRLALSRGPAVTVFKAEPSSSLREVREGKATGVDNHGFYTTPGKCGDGILFMATATHSAWEMRMI